MIDLAPIVLFVYNRPLHTQQTLDALSSNDLADQSVLYIYADGPKYGSSKEQLKAINETRNLIRSRKWCKEVHLIERERNVGLANNILEGVTNVVNKHGKVIVLEDDLVTSVGFLKYMNDALNIYQTEQSVMHISGYIYTNNNLEQQTLFLNILSCWGWGTWKRAWEHYVHDINIHLSRLNTRRKVNKFNIEGDADFYSQLVQNREGKIYSWAVRWYASWLHNKGYSLFPYRSLVKNIGHDGSGVHCGSNSGFNSDTVNYVVVNKIPIKENIYVRKKINSFYKSRSSFQASDLKSKLIRTIKNNLIFKKLKQASNLLMGKFVASAIPELRILKGAKDELYYIKSKSFSSEVSAKAKLYHPYTIIKSHIGAYTYIADNSYIQNTSIGKFCSIGPNFYCGRGIHPLDTLSTSPMFYSTLKQNGTSLSDTNKIIETKEVRIGNDVFIGMNVSVLDGVTIGHGAVIGAGAVVVKDIPPYAIAVGVPAKVAKYRFDNSVIDDLLRIKWWDFPEEKLKDVERDFFDVEKFIRENLEK